MIPAMWGKHAPYHHPKYDPLWAVCEELDVVINFHSGPSPMEDYFGPPPVGSAPVGPGAMGIYVSEVAWWNVRPLTFMIWGGVVRALPAARESRSPRAPAIWVPELLRLLDHRYEETHYSQKLGDYRSHLKSKPSEYFARNVLARRLLHAAARSRAAARDRHREHHVGQRLPASRRHVAARRASRCSRRSAACPSPRSRRCSAATPRASTASTPRSSRRTPRASAPRRRPFA